MKSGVFLPLLCLIIFTSTVSAGEGSRGAIFPDDIEEILSRKARAIEPLFQNPEISKAIRQANQEHRGITARQIEELDKKFQTAALTDPFVLSVMSNSCAEKLKQFQRENKGLAEIFITDAKGLNVCQTNRTSDYYQADEDWWRDSYDGGAGKMYHGPIDYDESAESESISLYIPIRHETSPSLAGVAKVVIDLDTVKEEL